MSNDYSTDKGEGILRTGYAKRRLYRSVTERAAVPDPEPVITK